MRAIAATRTGKSTEAAADIAPRCLLAIDYGRKRIGLAVADEEGAVARPLATIERKNRREDLRRLREIVREHGVRQIIVGHPLRLDGARGEMAREAERFAGRLRKHLGLPVELMDERLTSREAEQLLSKKGRKRKPEGHQVDAVAAAVILRDYLEGKKTGARG